MNLLVDMGNTRLKWAVANGLDIDAGQAIHNAELNRITLIQLWQDLPTPKQIAIACVSAGQLLDLVTSVANELWPGIIIIRAKSEAQGYGLTNAYQHPHQLGVDRWLSMVAGYHLYPQALCVVGCGTAMTVDMVDASGKHLGGLISPGLRLMKEALAKGTERLGFNGSVYAFGLATNTDDAIYNGTLLAASGLIESALKNQPDTTQLLLTGGDAEEIAARLSHQAVIEPDLVLRGLALMIGK
jgi:type III pantothenate kinase